MQNASASAESTETTHNHASIRIAYFISPHGFGHAARACAIMSVLQNQNPAIHFEIYTRVPSWFFAQQNGLSFSYHEVLTDVGLVQTDPMRHDLPATLSALERFIPTCQGDGLRMLADELAKLQCRLVVSDISPLGIVAANQAGIPSILVQNFTWDWLYKPYVPAYPKFAALISWMQEVYHSCSHVIRAIPFCPMLDSQQRIDLTAQPISRAVSQSIPETRRALGCTADDKIIALTMGGVEGDNAIAADLARKSDYIFMSTGRSHRIARHDNLIILPRQLPIPHPDIMNACDLVIGKPGYSTMSEVYYAGIPFWYFTREDFLENGPLADFADKNMHGVNVTDEMLIQGGWLEQLDVSLALPRLSRHHENGAMQAADFILSLL